METTPEVVAASSPRLSRWRLIAQIIAVLGLALSVYALRHHLQVKADGQSNAFCNINEWLSCDKVALSKYSEVFGFPMGIWGFAYFAACLVVATLGLREAAKSREHAQAYLLSVLAGAVAAVVLAYISSTKIQVLCPTCIAVYTLCGLQVLFAFVFRSEWPKPWDWKEAGNGIGTAVIAVAASVMILNYLQPSLAPEKAAEDPASPRKELPAYAGGAVEIPLNLSAFSGLGEDYRKGPDNAKVQLVEFADFECPACKQAAGVMHEVAQTYHDRVLFVFKNFPLHKDCNPAVRTELHTKACIAATLGRCAGQQGKFWQYHDQVYAQQSDLSPENAKKWARDLGLSAQQIDACLASADIQNKIKDDAMAGEKAGVDGTPTLYINGRKFAAAKTYDAIRQQIEILLNQ